MEFLYKEHVERNFEIDLIFFPMLYFGPNFAVVLFTPAIKRIQNCFCIIGKLVQDHCVNSIRRRVSKHNAIISASTLQVSSVCYRLRTKNRHPKPHKN